MIYVRISDGDEGMQAGSCPPRAESAPMNTKSRSLVLVNYFHSTPNRTLSCADNSAPLISMMKTCQEASGGNRWPNFIAVDYYQVSYFTNNPLIMLVIDLITLNLSK